MGWDRMLPCDWFITVDIVTIVVIVIVRVHIVTVVALHIHQLSSSLSLFHSFFPSPSLPFPPLHLSISLHSTPSSPLDLLSLSLTPSPLFLSICLSRPLSLSRSLSVSRSLFLSLYLSLSGDESDRSLNTIPEVPIGRWNLDQVFQNPYLNSSHSRFVYVQN